MAAIPAALNSARLTFKVHRFEVLAVTVAALVAAAAAVVVQVHLDGVGVSRQCLEQWIAGSGPESAGSCAGSVQRWAEINENEAGKVMATMAVLPWTIGLLLGVPLVGRELETRTAATAWALAGSRRRWLFGRLVPMFVLTLVLSGILAVGATILETTRNAGGVWVSPFNDAELFGPPLVAHALAGLGIGLFVGAIVGRTLPAVIVGAIVAIAIVNIGMTAQSDWVPDSAFGSGTISGGTSDRGPDPLDPWTDVRWFTSDNRLLSRDEALATVPAGTADVPTWLRAHYTEVDLGISVTKASEWQALETLGFLGVAGVLVLVAFPIVERRRPA
jgi:hypothetical protein